jgi:hypothetical protein
MEIRIYILEELKPVPKIRSGSNSDIINWNQIWQWVLTSVVQLSNFQTKLPICIKKFSLLKKRDEYLY